MRRKAIRLGALAALTLAAGGGEAFAEGPPRNPALAASRWPIYHADTYATASVRGRPLCDPTEHERIDLLSDRRFGRGGVSPWTVLRAPEANGDQVVLTTPVQGVAKYLIEGGRLHGVDFLRLDRAWTDFDWGIVALADGSVLVTEKRHNRFVVVGDARPGDPRSSLTVLRRWTIDPEKFGPLTTHFTVAFDGTIVALTENRRLLAVDPADGRVLVAADLPREAGLTFHNSFPIDETGRVYLVSQQAMLAFDWNGRTLVEAWTAPYDMRGPGCSRRDEGRSRFAEVAAVARGLPCTGCGTTPSLLGDRASGVVVVVDGHQPANRLVAFWRGAIPDGWEALRDPVDPAVRLDRRVAGVLPLPYSTPDGEGYTAENSPAVRGNSIVVAQWAGFAPDATPPTGVQRVDWAPDERRFRLVWANADVHFNGVPTIADGPDGPIALGMGREGDAYVYSVLDFATGERTRRIDLGSDDAVLDQGNNHVVADDGSVLFSGKGALNRLSAPR